MKKQAIVVLAILGAVAVSGANSTKLVFSWKNPSYIGGSFKNILVLAMNGEASSRADFEDQIVSEITKPGTHAAPSYSVMPRPESTPIDMDQLSGVVRAQSFDAVLVSRLVKYNKVVTNVPGRTNPLHPNYSTFSEYVAGLSPAVYSSGYLAKDTQVQIESILYSTTKSTTGDLIWTGTSDSVNPKEMSEVLNSVAKSIVQALEKGRMI